MRTWALIGAFALFLFGMLFALAAFVKGSGLGSEISLPLLAIAGVMALLGSLAVVAISFSLISLSDKTQALGLPNGSVRAVIALSLVVLFAILTVYLFSALHDRGPTRTVACLDASQRDAFVRDLRPGQLVGAVPSGKSAEGISCADGGSRFIVYFTADPDPASEDFAKQLLVLIGALVTTVSGFYFGSKSMADAQTAAGQTRDGPPSPTAATPSDAPDGSAGPVGLKVTGNSLNSVKQATVESGELSYTDANVTSNAGSVVASFAIPPEKRVGGWDVVLTDVLGRQARLRKAFTLGSPGRVIDAVKPATLGVGAETEVALSGPDLGWVKQVGLAAGDQSLSGTVIKVEKDRAVVTFDVPPGAVPGHYDIVLTGDDARRAVVADRVVLSAAS